MKNLFIKIISSPLFWTIPIYIAVIWVIPPFYQKYNLKLVKSEQLTDKKVFYKDLDSDGYSEKIVVEKRYGFSSISFFSCNDSLLTQMNLKHNTTDIELCKFEDYDNNGFKEFYFLTISNDSIFLNAIEYPKFEKLLFENKFITKIRKNYKGRFDIGTSDNPNSYDLNNDNYKEIYFYISAGYSYSPRRIFAYDIINDTVYSSPPNGVTIIPPNFYDFENDNSPELFFTTVATNNFKADYEVTSYPDTSAWLMLLNKNLEFVFEPIEFAPKGSILQIKPIKSPNKDTADIFVLHTSLISENTNPIAYIYDIKGKQLKQKIISKASNKKLSLVKLNINLTKIFFIDIEGDLYTFNYNLELIEKRNILNLKSQELIPTSFYDINNDGEQEIIFRHQSGITITDINFNNPVFIALENSGFAFPSIRKSKTGETFLWYKSINNTWYMLKYSKNKKYYYRYLIFTVIFIFTFSLLWILMTLRSKKLKADNKKLNKIVKERTQEIYIQNTNLEKLNNKLFASSLKIDQHNIEVTIQNEKMKKQAKELDVSNNKLIELGKFKQSLSAMIVHDLKNPLNIISNTAKQETIRNNANQMLNLVDNILIIQKFEDNKMQLNFADYNLSEILDKTINQIELLVKQKNIKLKNSINSNINVNTDQQLLQRIFVNLLTNAIKYTSNNGLISIKHEKLNNETLKLIISDNGVGMAEEDLTYIFKKFEQVNAKNYGNVKSSGIGLTFCKMATEAMGGNIGVVSKLGKGSDFYFTLKLSKSKTPKQKFIEKPKNTKNDYSLTEKEKKILHPFILELQKYEVYEVTEIKKVIKRIENLSNTNIKNWLNILDYAIYSSNEEQYNKIINN